MNLSDLLFPKHCVGCGVLGQYFCRRCRVHVKPIAMNDAICPVCERPAIDGVTHPKCQTRYAIDGLTSFFHYDGAIRGAIKELKYRFVSDLAKDFVGLIPRSIPGIGVALIPGIERMLVPIPLHPSRLRYRGFNQAELLGKLIAERLRISMRTDVLIRQKKTIPQVEMKEREKRLKNMEGVFAIQKLPINNEIQTIFLFDDVFTTGATMRSAANVLKRAGATFVWGITMAR